VKGLREHAYHFVSDTFWPMILGQIGFFGLFLYVFITIESLADSSFVQNRGVASFFILAIFVNMCTSNHKAVPAARECNT
jgi:hypothetical protein